MRFLAALLLMSLPCLASADDLTRWDFDGTTLGDWQPNGHLANVSVAGGVASMDATDWDPALLNRTVEFAATPWQYVVVRLRASAGGSLELFYSNTRTGEYGGLSQDKSLRVSVPGDGGWHELILLPGWQTEGTIRQLRLDPYADTHFEIDRIEVRDWSAGKTPLTDVSCWSFETPTDVEAWRLAPDRQELWSPPLDLPAAGLTWAAVRATSNVDREVSLLWIGAGRSGIQRRTIGLIGDGRPHTYNLEMDHDGQWTSTLYALGLEWPLQAAGMPTLEMLCLGAEPAGASDLAFDYFGFENAINRADRPASILAMVHNIGGRGTGPSTLEITPGAGLTLVGAGLRSSDAMELDETRGETWLVRTDAPGTRTVTITATTAQGAVSTATAALVFTAPLGLAQVDYVPEPTPVQSGPLVCMYYFPGWADWSRWAPIRGTAPIRKPVLGYYDEALPEIVDWQIKWARENGIDCFLLDWYWDREARHLEHWLDAYKQARYRDQLQFAIMWANHNPPGSHSQADLLKVTQYWIDQVFGLPGCLKIDGKPVVFIWNPEGIRTDLGGSTQAAAAYAAMKQLVIGAGYPGLELVAVNGNENSDRTAKLADEGYLGYTNYHEFGDAPAMAPTLRDVRFGDLVATAEAAWTRRKAFNPALEYYPVVDTGWDARPWHGEAAMVIRGRTADLLEALLRKAKGWLETNPSRYLVLGPANEWGEGSYIEPNLEFGFDNYERVRRVFGLGDPAGWPLNYGPTDVGLGPYDLHEPTPRWAWTFDGPKPLEGWSAMMGIADMRVEAGELRCTTRSGDSAFSLDTISVPAENYPAVRVRMNVSAGGAAKGDAQIFWSRDGQSISEAASRHFATINDGAMHEYLIPLADHPQWRSRITAIRFDPAVAADLQLAIDEFSLVPGETGATTGAQYR